MCCVGVNMHIFTLVVSEGFFSFSSVPSMVASVNVTERSATRITLDWIVDGEKEWSYFLQINGQDLQLQPNRPTNVVSHSITSLLPGTMYQFKVITMFSGLNSTAYEDFTVTGMHRRSL